MQIATYLQVLHKGDVKMKFITLLAPEGEKTSPRHQLVAKRLRELQEEGGRVYTTYTPTYERDSLDFRFVTTHKDTHLKLGRLDKGTLEDLSFLFEETLEDTAIKEIMVEVGGGHNTTWLVVRTQDGHQVKYFLSPA